MSRKRKKLLKGLILFGIYSIFNYSLDGADGLNRIQNEINTRLTFLPNSLSGILSSLIIIIICIVIVYCFVSGLFRIFTYNLNITQFEDYEDEY